MFWWKSGDDRHLVDSHSDGKHHQAEAALGCRPLISPHFNITVELRLKAITRGYSWLSVPVIWRNRRTGESKFKVKEMGNRYLFICLYILLEKLLSRGDWRKNATFTA
jgi:dolichol-phosphate mannosyltransferase